MPKLKDKRWYGETVNYFFYVLGCAVYSVAIVMFINPARLSPGGITGLATVLHYLTNFPTGAAILVMNIPIAVTALVFYGKKFVVRTLSVTVCLSLILSVAESTLKPIFLEPILAALYGGILMGFGIGLIMYRGSTTGGIDIIAKLINRKFPSVSLGKGLLLIDAAIIIINAVVHKSMESMLYTIIALFISSKVIDLVIYGGATGKIIYIVSDDYEEIADKILKIIGRGVTVINTLGAYTKTERKMLMCAVRPHEVSKVMMLVKQTDKCAFISVADASLIEGNGFKINQIQ